MAAVCNYCLLLYRSYGLYGVKPGCAYLALIKFLCRSLLWILFAAAYPMSCYVNYISMHTKKCISMSTKITLVCIQKMHRYAYKNTLVCIPKLDQNAYAKCISMRTQNASLCVCKMQCISMR